MKGDSNASPLAYLMNLLSHPVIRKNVNLMDVLLRLLSIVSASLPDKSDHARSLRSNAVGVSSQTNQSAGRNILVRLPESGATTILETYPPPPIDSGIGDYSGSSSLLVAEEIGSEPMDVEVHSLTSSASNNTESAAITQTQLRLAVDVLTNGSCSDEGLDDVTTVLLQVRLNC